ncbi:MAG: phosphoribosylglycinamide formyltransferase [Pseudomonadota bacterium]
MSGADAHPGAPFSPERRARLGVLISGRGSNMLALARAAQAAEFPAEIALVAADGDAPGLEAAAALGLETACVRRAEHADKAGFEAALAARLEAARLDALCLAGFMRILSAGFLAPWEGRALNIHPSLLPSFPGLDTHARALAAGARLHGATVHLVTPKVDDGPILAQAALAVAPGESADALAGRVLALEHRLYPAALARHLSGARPTAEEAAAAGALIFPAP